MRRAVWIILFILLLSTAAQAQETVPVTLTEAQLNQALNSRFAEMDKGTPYGTLETMNVDLQPMKVVLFGKLKRPNNEMWTYRMTLVSTVIAQRQEWSLDNVVLIDAAGIVAPRDVNSTSAMGMGIGMGKGMYEWIKAYLGLLSDALHVSPSVAQTLPVTSLTISTGSLNAPSGIIAILISVVEPKGTGMADR